MTDDEIRETDDQPEPISNPVIQEIKTPFPWGGILLAIWAVALVIFSVQNAENTTLRFLGWSFDMPVAIVVIVTALVTVVLTGVGLSFWRRRRVKEAKRMMERRQSRDSSQT